MVVTATATAPATVTPTPSSGVPTVTPTTAAMRCVGDCDGDGHVAINELIAGVGVALGTQPLDACIAFDANHSGTVTIDELIAAVTNALSGCPAA